MNIVYSKDFVKQASKLPKQTQIKLDGLVGLLHKNPFHPLLHSKPLTGSLKTAYSFRITREWRVIFGFENKDTIKLFKVGNRKDIYK